MTPPPPSALIVLGLVAFAALAPAAPPDAREIARSLDTFRRPEKSFEVRMAIREIRHGREKSAGEFQIFAHRAGGRSRFDTLTLCLAPESDRNKVVLGRGEEVWLYDPKAARPVRIEPRQMRGKFWEIDVLSASFAEDYAAELLPDGIALDAGRVERSCHRVKLTLRDPRLPSPASIEYWVDRETGYPVQGRFYNAGGRLMRTAYYAEFARVLGVMRPMRGFVVNGLERGLVEDIRFTGLAYSSVPGRFFTPEALAEVSRGAVRSGSP